MIYTLSAVILGLVGYVLWRLASVRRAEAWEEELRAGYRRRIALDAKNIGAYEALAESLHQAGRLDEARDTYLAALEAGGGELPLERTQYKLRQVDFDIRARAQAKGRRGPAREPELVFCAQCGSPNPPQRRHCELCHTLLPFNSFWDALRSREIQRSSVEGLCILAVMAVALQIFGFLSFDVKGTVIIATLIVVSWRLLKAIDGQRG
jgi:hypothetical protein